METKPTDQPASAMDPAFATGLFLGRFANSTLGEMSLGDAFGLATAAASSPDAVGAALDLPLDVSRQLNPVAVRGRMMDSYFAQRFAQDLASMIDERRDEEEADGAERVIRMAASAGLTEDQVAAALAQAQAGDCSAMNKAEEMYFFE